MMPSRHISFLLTLTLAVRLGFPAEGALCLCEGIRIHDDVSCDENLACGADHDAEHHHRHDCTDEHVSHARGEDPHDVTAPGICGCHACSEEHCRHVPLPILVTTLDGLGGDRTSLLERGVLGRGAVAVTSIPEALTPCGASPPREPGGHPSGPRTVAPHLASTVLIV